MIFRSLGVPASELSCHVTLVNGQCFNWRRRVKKDEKKDTGHVGSEWIGVLNDDLVILRQEATDTSYYHVHGPSQQDELVETLRDYFQLDKYNLKDLYASWSSSDPRFKQLADYIPGLRLIRGAPVESLFSFICSSNNNIARITMMLSRLRQEFGKKLYTFEDVDYYSFPTVQSLAKTTEKRLRSLGLGYRAKYVLQTAQMLNERGGSEWLNGLRKKPYSEVQEQLIGFHGIGRKVADCISLFSLDKLDAIPIDTHVWQIVCRDYRADFPTLEKKSLTKAVYSQIGDFFRSRFGPQAGWALSILFTLDLPVFNKLLPSHLQLTKGKKKKTKDAEPKKKATKRKNDESDSDVTAEPKKKATKRKNNDSDSDVTDSNSTQIKQKKKTVSKKKKVSSSTKKNKIPKLKKKKQK